MSKTITLLAVASLFLSITSGMENNDQPSSCEGSRTWCVVKPSSNQVILQANIDYACSKVDCSCLQTGGSCFSPDNLFSQASVAMNLYYKSYGMKPENCDFANSGLVVVTDPSYGNCIYQ